AHVRVHTDARGQTAAGRTGARAFAHGGDVAFAPGQHRPGTPVGDALLAHELAHTLQQNTSTAPASLALNGASALEADADRSAFGAMGRLWGAANAGFPTVGSARPALTSALHIARCGEAPTIQADPQYQPKKTVDVQPHVIEGTERSFDDDIAYANTRVFPQANVELNKLTAQGYSAQAAHDLVGEDLELEKGSNRSTEEQDLESRFKSTTQVNVVYVHSFEGCTETKGRAYRDTDVHGAMEGMAVVTDKGSMTTLPHEIGHLMSLDHRSSGSALMTGSGTTDRTVALNDDEIRKIRASNYAH
ncbi:MAG: eCIS core domain-containing protein, partial [Steroidobacteraceae bacterium]